MQFGGPKLAVQTIDQLLGKSLPVNHVVIVDFNQFEKLIDAVGGITVERAGEHPLEPVRLPVPRRSSAASSGRAGASTRARRT